MSNLSQQKRERLISFLETLKKNANDDESLQAIGEIENELNSKKYGLVWEHHEEKVDEVMKDNIPIFSEVRDKEIKECEGDDYNFLLEGDNLHSLKLLEKTHKGRINVIYIDPPYNTGKKDDFTYDDSYIDKNDAFRHSKWISFMSERLVIARELLSPEGFIFISIDDDEQAALKMLCDEVFGQDNFVANLIWEKKYTVQNDARFFSDNHDFVLCYAKSISHATLGKMPRTEKMNKAYKNPDDDPRGPWKSTPLHAKSGSNISSYTFENGKTFTPPKGAYRRFNDESMKRMFDNNEIWFGKNGDAVPSKKTFLSEISSAKGVVPPTILKYDVAGLNADGVDTMKDIFSGANIFTNPKPVKLIKLLVNLGLAGKKDAAILDFFAGSGTTAQAVLELNKEDGGHRHFVLCTNNENSICEKVTYPRVKTVITGIRPDGTKYSDGIPANLKYYKTGFVSMKADDVSSDLMDHVAEMIQLEHGVSIDGKQYVMVLSDDDADNLEKNYDAYTDLKGIYRSRDVMWTGRQERLFKNIPQFIIPDYYFKFELKEVGEAW